MLMSINPQEGTFRSSILTLAKSSEKNQSSSKLPVKLPVERVVVIPARRITLTPPNWKGSPFFSVSGFPRSTINRLSASPTNLVHEWSRETEGQSESVLTSANSCDDNYNHCKGKGWTFIEFALLDTA